MKKTKWDPFGEPCQGVPLRELCEQRVSGAKERKASQKTDKQTERTRKREGRERRAQKPRVRECKPFVVRYETAPIWIDFVVHTPGVTENRV